MTAPEPVLSLATARKGRRVALTRARVEERLLEQRAAFDALCASGAVHTARGAREGKRLLDAGLHLQRAASVLKMLAGKGTLPAPRLEANVDEAFQEVESRIEQADTLLRRKPAAVKQLGTGYFSF